MGVAGGQIYTSQKPIENRPQEIDPKHPLYVYQEPLRESKNVVGTKYAADDDGLSIDATLAFFRNTLGSLSPLILGPYIRGHRDIYYYGGP